MNTPKKKPIHRPVVKPIHTPAASTIYRSFAPLAKRINTPDNTPFFRGLYHGQWITLLTLGSLLLLFAILSWAGQNPPGLPMGDIIPTTARGSAMPLPDAWTGAGTLQKLCEAALEEHFVSLELTDGTARIDMLAQLSPVYPSATDEGSTQALSVNPINAEAARQVAAYLMKACFTQFPNAMESVEIHISYPYRDGYGGKGLAPGDVLILTKKDAAALNWRSVTSSALVKQTLQ